MHTIDSASCLIVVDVQRDFCPGGALGVNGGDEIVPVLNLWIHQFLKKNLPVLYTQDWHPQDHISFLDQGGIWPPHCVQSTPGASFCPGLTVQGEICRKGYLKDCEAYSGFDGSVGALGGPSLHQWLKKKKVSRIYAGGLATDYCVKATVLDGLKKGYQVTVLKNAIRAVNVKPGDAEKALDEMAKTGAVIKSF